MAVQEIDEFSESKQSLWKTEEEKALKKSIFEFYSQLYHSKRNNEKSVFAQKTKETIRSIILCFQTMSLLWIPNLSISNWDENKTIWIIIGYSRLDNICSDLGIITDYLYFSISFILIIFLIIVAMVLREYFSKNLSILVLNVFKWIFDLWMTIFLIPSLTLYAAILKYNFLPQNYISIYRKYDNYTDFELNAAWQVVIILIMIIMLILIIFYVEFSGEIRHSLSSKVSTAKAHSKVDINIAIFIYFASIIYAVTSEDHMIHFQILMMAFTLILIAEVMVFFPYFSIYYTVIKILELYAIALISFGFILGCLMDNSLVIIFIAIFLGPILAIFIIQLALKLQNKLAINIPENLADINSKYKLEKLLRHSLCSNNEEQKNQIIHIFDAFFIDVSTDREKLQMIWLANYCLFSLKDEPLAKIKLSRIKNISKWDLEADFQEYICNKKIQASLLSESDQFTKYLQKLHLIQKKDLKLCVKLFKLWDEINSKKPDHNQIIKLLAWIDKKMIFLEDQYSQVLTKFPNCRESLALYTSFKKDVLFDNEKANFLENKLNAISNSMMNSESNLFSCFDDSNAILIFSAEEESFGQILFSNALANDLMKNKSLRASEENIKSFIPSYYWEKLKECAIWYSKFCSESEATLDEGFILSFLAESLSKCVGKISITAIENFLVFILVFTKNSQINQIALLNENGEILSHTKNFSQIVESNIDNLIGYNLKTLFSGPEQYSPGKDTALSEKNLRYYNVQFRSLKIFYALFISDYGEKTINKDFNNLLDINEKKETLSPQSLNLLEPELLNEGLKNTYQAEISLNTEMNLNTPNSINYQEISEISSSEDFFKEKSDILQNTKFSKLITSSCRKINMLHFAIILSILSVLGTNIGVLFYAFSKIDFIRNMDLPLAIGNVDAKLQHVSLTARIVWSLSYYGGPEAEPVVQFSWSFFPGHLQGLKDLYFNITSNLKDWNYCSGQSIFTDDNIKIWSSSENGKISLLDLLSKSIQIGSEFERKFLNNENYTEEIAFLALNNFGEVTKYCNASLYQVIDCQKSIMLDFKTEVFVLLILSVGVLGLCACVMIPICFSIINNENKIWNSLRKLVYENSYKLKQTLLERIKNVHCQPEILVNTGDPSNKKINFKNYWKYIWRISIYFIVVAIFSIINITYLYEKCTEYLSYRPDVMKEIINRKILQNCLAIWTTLSQFEFWGIPSVDQYFYIYPYMNTHDEFQKTVLLLKQSSFNLKNPKYSPILSSTFKTMFYEEDHYLSEYFTYGTSLAEELTLIESFFYAYLNPTIDAWKIWLLNILFTNLHYSDLANEVDRYSQSVIEAQVHAIITTLAIFVVSSISIYFLIYYVFFKREKQSLKKINSILKLMPK